MALDFDLDIRNSKGGGNITLVRKPAEGDIHVVTVEAKGTDLLSITFTAEADMILFEAMVRDLTNTDSAHDDLSILTLIGAGSNTPNLYLDGQIGDNVIFSRKQLLTNKKPALAFSE